MKHTPLYDPYIQPKNGPGTIAPRLIGHSPRPDKPKKVSKFKDKPKAPKRIMGNPEGGKDLFDFVFVCFIIYLLLIPILY